MPVETFTKISQLYLRVVVGAAEVQVGLVGHWGVEEGDVLALVPVERELQMADHQQENLSKERVKKHAIITSVKSAA